LRICDLRFAICVFLIVGFIAICPVACDEEKVSTANRSPVAPPRVEPVYGSGTVRGSVQFVGAPPQMATIENKPCHADAKPLKEETVVVNDNGTLANVFVYLADAPPSDGSSREPALLDQVDCRYAPHVVGVQVGQPLVIRSSDPTLHNVHYNAERNPPANFGLTVKGAQKQVKFESAEFIRVKCDVHPWMTAYVGVFDSPFYSVSSDEGGAFEIAKVPAGKYRLVAWHERYGQVERAVEVSDDKSIDVTVTYKAP
jgi:plastocyanin